MKIYSHYSECPTAQWHWPDFTPKEMACRGTGKLAINVRAMDMLQALRNELGKPMVVNSAYRSPEHNKAEGGAENSEHLRANAFDVQMAGHDPNEYIRLARMVGFQGIGEYADKGFVHVDGRENYAHFGTENYPRETVVQPVDYVIADPEPRGIASSTTLQATAATAAAAAGTVATGVSGLTGTAQIIVIVAGVVMLAGLLWIARERIKKWADGDR